MTDMKEATSQDANDVTEYQSARPSVCLSVCLFLYGRSIFVIEEGRISSGTQRLIRPIRPDKKL